MRSHVDLQITNSAGNKPFRGSSEQMRSVIQAISVRNCQFSIIIIIIIIVTVSIWCTM